MAKIALNFLRVRNDEFRIQVYATPKSEGERPLAATERMTVRRLDLGDGYRDFWTMNRAFENATLVDLNAYNNIYVTLESLRHALEVSCRSELSDRVYEFSDDFRRQIEIVVEEYEEGKAIVALDPYYLRNTRRFGILLKFKFHPKEEFIGTSRAQQLSLSLDRNGQQNLDFYADRHLKITDFVRDFHGALFPLRTIGGQLIEVDKNLTDIPSARLGVKSYIMKDERESRSQYIGVKTLGPYDRQADDTQLCFIYRRSEHAFSQDLYRALRGDTFKTFSGMDDMFKFPLTKQNVRGTTIANFNSEEIKRISELVAKDAGDRPVIPVVLTPFNRTEETKRKEAYYVMKHAFLSKGIPIQFVSSNTITDKNKLKWSTAGIGLQIFAKAGGTPWRVAPATERCLIVGVGQAHKIRFDNEIERYFAFSVLTDSTGTFQEIRELSTSTDEATYLQVFGENLANILRDYKDQFNSFVIHSTFTIRKRELDTIATILKAHSESESDSTCVSMKFNNRNRFFGFDTGHNSLVPFESTMVALSNSEYLVWFEGRQYGKSVIHKRIGNPVHVSFTYPDTIIRSEKLRYLQDAINLSGANWRGFNAKSLPVSVYYAQIIAKYLKEFEDHGLETLEIDHLKPWFL